MRTTLFTDVDSRVVGDYGTQTGFFLTWIELVGVLFLASLILAVQLQGASTAEYN